jgi:hypothetical protein
MGPTGRPTDRATSAQLDAASQLHDAGWLLLVLGDWGSRLIMLIFEILVL